MYTHSPDYHSADYCPVFDLVATLRPFLIDDISLDRFSRESGRNEGTSNNEGKFLLGGRSGTLYVYHRNMQVHAIISPLFFLSLGQLFEE